MAAAKKHSRKVRNKSSFFCFFRGCFGISNKVSADHGDAKSLKNARTTSGSRHGRPPPPPETLNSSTEICVGENHEEKRDKILAPSADEFIINKDITYSEKMKKKDESSSMTSPTKQHSIITQEPWAKSTKLSHSMPLPLFNQGKEKSSTNEKGKNGRERKVNGELDPMVGAVIIMVTLMVMVIWGKVCAILCTASWFYFIPRFRANMDDYYAIQLQNGENHHLDLDSKEYKKKVVLQGLLDRNQHI